MGDSKVLQVGQTKSLRPWARGGERIEVEVAGMISAADEIIVFRLIPGEGGRQQALPDGVDRQLNGSIVTAGIGKKLQTLLPPAAILPFEKDAGIFQRLEIGAVVDVALN
jgi:hypothetical protein